MGESIETEFANIELGDERRNRRLRSVVRRLWESPSKSIKASCRGWAETVAAYRLLNNPGVDVEKVIEPHREACLRRAGGHRRVLAIQDTSELDYTTKKSLGGSGPLGTTERRGFFLHCNLVVGEERLPLGIWDCNIYARCDEEHGKAAGRKRRPIEEKESYRWLTGYRKACELSEELEQSEVVSISDREGDVYEVFAEWQDRLGRDGVAAEWIIRANQNRMLAGKDSGSKLFDRAQQGKLLGVVQFEVRDKEQFKKVSGNSVKVHRKGRKVVQEIRVTTVQLKAPARKGERLPPVEVCVLSAREKRPPKGQDPIEWKLITSLPVRDLQEAKEVTEMYLARWEIEVFHRVLKSGCRVEELQLKEDGALLPCVALYAIIAWRILYLTHLGRECPDLPSGFVFEEREWKSTVTVLYGKQAAKKEPALGRFIAMIGELGGHLGRTNDGEPGPQAIWQGLQRIRDFSLAWEAMEGG